MTYRASNTLQTGYTVDNKCRSPHILTLFTLRRPDLDANRSLLTLQAALGHERQVQKANFNAKSTRFVLPNIVDRTATAPGSRADNQLD